MREKGRTYRLHAELLGRHYVHIVLVHYSGTELKLSLYPLQYHLLDCVPGDQSNDSNWPALIIREKDVHGCLKTRLSKKSAIR